MALLAIPSEIHWHWFHVTTLLSCSQATASLQCTNKQTRAIRRDSSIISHLSVECQSYFTVVHLSIGYDNSRPGHNV